MVQKIELPELSSFMMDTGLSVVAVSKITTLSRNTVMAIRDGDKVGRNSLSKLLTGLENAQYDVTALRTEVDRRLQAERAQAAVGQPKIRQIIDNTTAMRSAARTGAILSKALEKAEGSASELADIMRGGDVEIGVQEMRDLKFFKKKLDADFERILQLIEET